MAGNIRWYFEMFRSRRASRKTLSVFTAEGRSHVTLVPTRQGGTSQDVDLHPLKLCDAVQDYLKVAHGEVSKELVKMRRKRFQIFSTDDLVHELRASQPDDWKIEPVYYFAMTKEIKERLTPPPTNP